MKLFYAVILFLALKLSPCNASQHQVVIGHVTMPTYYNKTSPVRYIPKPIVGWDLTRDFLSTYYDAELFVGEGDMRYNINLISRYNLKVEFIHENGALNIISKGAKKNGEFSVDDVIKMTLKAIRSDYPDKKAQVITIDGVAVK